MSLRRTALARRAELRRTPLPRRTKAVAERARKTIGRQRDTGPTPTLRALVAERAGYCCERCGARLHDGNAWTATHSFHHRLPRGRGGRNEVPNLVLLCGSGVTGCHGQVEARRADAYAAGWLVETGIEPASMPIDIPTIGPVVLTEDGDYAPTQENRQ